MWIDKSKAIGKSRRILERNLFIVALLGGSGGIYLGMKKPLYHKAAKSNFRYFIPLIILLQLGAFLYFSLR
jgi:uncharacterized membrane protein YsdA (DUF1294 family)